MLLKYTFLAGSIFLISFQNTDDKIIWKRDTKLQWENYLGKIPESPHAAISCCTIDGTYQNNNDSILFMYQAIFIKSQSWVKPKYKNEYILNHEQGHFDLTEIYTRLLRLKLSKFRFSKQNFEHEFKSLYDLNLERFIDENKTYDEDTKNYENQLVWNNKIAERLDSLKKYERVVTIGYFK